MKIFRFYTIRSRIAFFTLSAIFMLLFTRVIIETIHTNNELETEIAYQLDHALDLGTSSLESPLWDYNLENTQDILEVLLHDPNIVKVELRDEIDDVIQMLSKDHVVFENDSIISSSGTVVHDGLKRGTLTIWMSNEIYKLRLQQVIHYNFLYAILEVLLVSLVIWSVSARTTRPIESLISMADDIASGKLDTVIECRSNDEVGLLSKALDSMQSQIGQQMIELEKDKVEITALYDQSTAMNTKLEKMLLSLNQNYEETLSALARAIEVNDHYTKGHCDRVSEYALSIADQLGLCEYDKEILLKASILHDIGKIGVATHIINKEGKLDDDEYDQIKAHCLTGYNIIKDVDFLKESASVVLQHHERFDGNGYPNQLTGTDINLLARILSVADTFDAMTSSRAYRKKPLSDEQALAELHKHSGLQFDPLVVNAWMRCLDESA
ncbi:MULTISPECIES: HD-GYP domain-containing protein [unclassified Fusibacter]|uniref:HD-GYP domain-containing protein n=1 Tax=unclassified Fusibacter TaxID=2624464 RepID=UPI0010121842|nr:MULTISPECIES: HD-GYP domain-containing protein [unclassified Fusibacter]MCK8058341.1 HD domain-containing protein [Fusibacter sp. A2]NPE20924.1 HD domain-containing protein [Fusibacter sp. A1]RXV63127.1 HD domain-containing protein [Fusibacter sp. A1]